MSWQRTVISLRSKKAERRHVENLIFFSSFALICVFFMIIFRLSILSFSCSVDFHLQLKLVFQSLCGFWNFLETVFFLARTVITGLRYFVVQGFCDPYVVPNMVPIEFTWDWMGKNITEKSGEYKPKIRHYHYYRLPYDIWKRT